LKYYNLRDLALRSIASILFLWAGISQSFAGDFPGKTFGVDIVGGFPQLVGLELSYLGWTYINPTLSFGSGPINGLLGSLIPLSPMPVNLAVPDTYNLYPSANFGLSSFSFYLKCFFAEKSGFFVDLMLARASFSASVSGNLRNETTQNTLGGAVSGSASLSQLMVGLAVGYQINIASTFFIEGAVGGGYLLAPTYGISFGGSAASFLAIAPNGEQMLENAKAELQSSFDSAISTYISSVRYLPFAFLNVGFTF
jgi:hypothetical protein